MTAPPPSPARERAIAAPIPLAPPVTNTTRSLSCRSMSEYFYTIESLCIGAKHLLLLGSRQVFHIIRHQLMRLPVGSGQQTNRPVRTKQQPIGPKGLEYHVEIGLEIVGAPGLPIGLGDQAGNFAVRLRI